MKLSIYRPYWVMPLVVFALTFVLMEAAHQVALFKRLEYIYSDTWHQLAGKRFDAQHVAMVLIDDVSLNTPPYDTVPLAFWTPYYAQAAKVMRQVGVSVIGVDIFAATSAEYWFRSQNFQLPESQLNYDLSWREEIARGGIVLVCSTKKQDDGLDTLDMPIQDILLSVPDQDLQRYFGFSDLFEEGDGAYRSYLLSPRARFPKELLESQPPRYNFAALLAMHATKQDPISDTPVFAERRMRRDQAPANIVFAGPRDSIPKVSFLELLKPDALQNPKVQALKHKVVILGSDYAGLNDIHATPYTTGLLTQVLGNQMVSGPEIQANIVETLLSGRRIVPLPAGWLWLLMSLMWLGAAFGFRRWSFLYGVVFLLLGYAMAAGLGYLSFMEYVSMPVVLLQAGLTLTFMLTYGLRLGGEQRQRALVERMFGRYVSKKVVERMIASGRMPELGGEALEVSVLFTDIRGFTTLSEKLDAKEVVELLNHYFERACVPLLEENGNLDKFIGDAIMVEFGAPEHRADHAACAVRAAVRLAKVAEEFSHWVHEHFPDRGLAEFRVGVGVHSGPAVVGSIGTTTRSEYTAIGDTVNVASRLEGVTKELGCSIVISEATLKAAGPRVITGKQSTVAVKGREEPLNVYEVLGWREL